MTTGRVERRRHPRRPAAELGWLRATRLRPGLEAVLMDLSSGGALVETTTRLRPGMKTVLHLKLPDGELQAPGGVVRAWVWAILPNRGLLYRGAVRFDRPMASPKGTEAGSPE